jgi:hypothetical protein
VIHWIGALIDYDREHHSELLKTLFAYLNEFGALEATAAKLYVHRNSLRYRLMRIAELTGWDLNDPEHRFHLNLACRAWLVLQALEGPSPTTLKPRDTNGSGVPTGSLLLAGRPGPCPVPSPARTRNRSRSDSASRDRSLPSFLGVEPPQQVSDGTCDHRQERSTGRWT